MEDIYGSLTKNSIEQPYDLTTRRDQFKNVDGLSTQTAQEDPKFTVKNKIQDIPKTIYVCFRDFTKNPDCHHHVGLSDIRVDTPISYGSSRSPLKLPLLEGIV